MAYDPLLTPEDSWAIELDCGTAFTGTFYTGTYVTGSYVTGTYYYVTSVIDVTIHSGTSFRIRPGTYADYHSQELAQDTSGDTSVDIYAIEGEWKILRSNENNLMVSDVASFPIARMVQWTGADDNRTNMHYEFPHHHMMPKELNGNTTTLKSGDFRGFGLATHGDYVFFTVPTSGAGTYITIHRIDMRDGTEVSTPNHFPSEILQLYVTDDYEFAILDDDTILFLVTDVTDTMGIWWATYNFSTGEFDTKVWVFPYKYPYILWHWAVIGKYLCINWASYNGLDYSPFTSYYSFSGAIYDYTTGELKAQLETPNIKNWSNLQYPRCNDLIVGKKYFTTHHFNTGGGGTAGYDDYARMFVFDVENFTISVIKLSYVPTIKGGTDGVCEPTQMCYNPFNGMIYWWAYYSYKYDGTHYKWCYAIMIMSPDNYSHTPIYEYYWNNVGATPTDATLTPAMLVPGMFEVYCVMESGHVYNVRDMPNVGGSPTAFLPPYIWEAEPTQDWQDNYDKAQHDKCASCLDRWDRMWYIDGSYVVAVNFVTGDEEARIDAGITNVWRGTYCFPNFDWSFQSVYLARDRLLVFCNAKGICPAHPATTDYIYMIE